MDYFSDRIVTTGFCICLVCGAFVPTDKVTQEYGGDPEIDAQELHLQWHRDFKTI